MRAVVTGINGTVAPVLAQTLVHNGHEVKSWNRSVIKIDNQVAMQNFLQQTNPDWFFHLATGSPAWAESVARICAEESIKFLFTSSVSVYSPPQRGPFGVDIPPTPEDDYGVYKLDCEQKVRAVNPEALVVRLGWQIGLTAGGNHMLDYLICRFREMGYINASKYWYPACSFLPDTADSIIDIIQNLSAGLYHLDGNPGLNFYQIVCGLNTLHGDQWIVNPDTIPNQNNQLSDEYVQVRSISSRLKT